MKFMVALLVGSVNSSKDGIIPKYRWGSWVSENSKRPAVWLGSRSDRIWNAVCCSFKIWHLLNNLHNRILYYWEAYGTEESSTCFINVPGRETVRPWSLPLCHCLFALMGLYRHRYRFRYVYTRRNRFSFKNFNIHDIFSLTMCSQKKLSLRGSWPTN